MDNNTQIQNQEEISLLDLFTVLLRYRKLIGGIIILFVILSIAGYFIYPVYQYNKAKSGLLTQGIIQMEIVPKAQGYISQSLDIFILRPDIIYESLYTAGMKEFPYKGGKISLVNEDKVKVMYLIDLFWIKNMDLRGNTYIRKDQDKIFNVRKISTSTSTSTNTNTNIGTGTNTGTNMVCEITLKNKDPELIDKFLNSIYSLCTANVENNLRASAQMMVDDYEHLMNLPGASESIKTILEKNFDTYGFYKNFLSGKEAAVKLVSGPVFVEGYVSLVFYQDQYPRTGIIIVFAGIFLAVMLAFVLNAIRNIKNDEESMKKIRDALGNSDSK